MTTPRRASTSAMMLSRHVIVAVLVVVAFSSSSSLTLVNTQASINQRQNAAIEAQTTPTTTTTSSSVSLISSPDQSGAEFSLSSASSSAAAAETDNNSPTRLVVSHPAAAAARRDPVSARQFGDTINDIQIECNSDNIVVTLATAHGFNGMIYPKGLSKNSTCMMEYHQTSSNITYYLPLRSCNTMSTDVEDGVEYFNTVMVQPHRRLVTNQGRGYHIKCRYQTKERTITNQEQQLNVNLNHSTPAVVGSASMPSCTMKIYSAQDLSREVAAENVRIGDELHLVISLEDQDVYGMLVTNCLVRDGMNWGEQPLIDDHGCPVDEDIMPQFSYVKNLSRASVTFQAHKFPYTSSVYYQCNVKLCFLGQSCSHVPPNCDNPNSNNNNNNKQTPGRHFKIDSNSISQTGSAAGRNKRWIDGGELDAVASEEVLSSANRNPKAMNIEVFSGLHVDESTLAAGDSAAAADKDPIMMASTSEDPATETAATDDQPPQKQQQQQQHAAKKRQSERDFCMSLRKLAIAISLVSLLLLLLSLILIGCMIQRRKRRRMQEQEEEAEASRQYAASNYPYHNNRAYLRD